MGARTSSRVKGPLSVLSNGVNGVTEGDAVTATYFVALAHSRHTTHLTVAGLTQVNPGQKVSDHACQ